MTTETADTSKLATLVAQRHQCLLELRDLGCRQLELVGAGELATLMTVLAAKQRLLVGLNSIERALDPFRQQDPAQRPWPSRAAREQCAEQANDCERLLAEIVRQEQLSEVEMVRQRDRSAQQLHATHTAAVARGAYAAGTRSRISQLDLSTES